MYERFSDRSRNVMVCATNEAIRFNHEYIGTEHLLLGLCKHIAHDRFAGDHSNGGGLVGEIFQQLNIDYRKIRLETEKLMYTGPEPVLTSRLPHTPRSKNVILNSCEIARERNDYYVGTQHLLLALLKEKEGIAHVVLESLGITENIVLRALDVVEEEQSLKSESDLDAVAVKLQTALRSFDIKDVRNWFAEIEEYKRQKENPVLIRETARLLFDHFMNGAPEEEIANKLRAIWTEGYVPLKKES